MSSVVKTLEEFIETAKKNRKYPSGTAIGRRAALRLFETELNDEERESLDTLKSHLEEIYQNVSNKNKSKMTAESLVTYRSRLKALISDYEQYGINPTKMANWNRTVRKRQIKDQIVSEEKNLPSSDLERYKEVDMSRFELPIRAGIKAVVLVPSDITNEEIDKLRKYIDFLGSISGGKINEEK